MSNRSNLRSLSLFLLLIISFTTQSQSNTLEAKEGEYVLAEINTLMSSGELEPAYQLASQYRDLGVGISLRLAQLALLLGHEGQSKAIFSGLQRRSDVSSIQKKNMRMFNVHFNLALEKKIKLAERWVKSDGCEEASAVLISLVKYQSSQRQAKKYLKQCRAKKRSISLRLGSLIGVDSNVALTNEELLKSQQSVMGGRYQDWSLLVKSKPGNTRLSDVSHFNWTPSYYFSSREYDEDVPSYYDQINHKAEMVFKLENWSGLDWRMPIYFRYSEYADQHHNNSYGTKLSVSGDRGVIKNRVSLHWKKKEYIDRVNQDHNSTLLDIGYQLGWNLNSVNLQARINQQELSSPEKNNDRYQSSNLVLKVYYRLPVATPFNFRYRAFASYAIKARHYQGQEGGVTREDLRQKYQAGLSIYNKQWRLQAQYSAEQRESNVSVYDFQRNKFELGIYYVL